MDIRYSFLWKEFEKTIKEENDTYSYAKYHRYGISFRNGKYVRPFKLFGTGQWDDSRWIYISFKFFDIELGHYIDNVPLINLSWWIDETKGLKIIK